MFNLSNWLQGKHIDAFSRELAQEFARRYSLEMAQEPPDKKMGRKLDRALTVVYRQAREFRKDRRLGVYGTARLGNGFKWELKEMGYRQDFIEQATKGLILNVRGD
jgi:hypothetical protein